VVKLKNHEDIKPNAKALLPFLIFLGLFLLTGIVLLNRGADNPFYQFPMPIAVSIGVVIAFIMFEGSINEKMNTLLAGMGEKNILTMCTIYLLAGAFSSVSQAMGGVDSVVNLGMSLVPIQFLAVGLFLITAFISISTGTSMGTMAAVVPIAIGIAEQANMSMAFVMAIVIGGAMFGDNLSIISDTTIAATATQNVEMKDKFRINLFIAVPAAIVTIVLLFIFSGSPEALPGATYEYSFIKIIPYLFVLIFAVGGMNVFAVLTSGIFLSGAIGLFTGDLTLLSITKEAYAGFTSMQNVFLVSLITGGLAYMILKEGGIKYIVNAIEKRVGGKKSGELGISALVALTDAAIANNTVSIIINGPIAKNISNKFKIDPRRVASLLDIFACVMQGALPYGAQILMVMGLTQGAVGPIDVIPLLWYQMSLAVFGILSIYIPFADSYINKHPWDFEEDEVAA